MGAVYDLPWQAGEREGLVLGLGEEGLIESARRRTAGSEIRAAAAAFIFGAANHLAAAYDSPARCGSAPTVRISLNGDTLWEHHTLFQ